MELRSLMEEVKTIKVEREVIETTLRDPVADIGKRKGEGGRREGGKMREGRSIGTHTHTHAHTHTLPLFSLTQLPSSCRL